MRRLAGSTFLAAALLMLAGCAQTFDANRLGVPVTMSSPPGGVPEGSQFKLSAHSTYALWGIASVSQPSLRKALASQLGNGSGVADLKIRTHSSFFDVLITVVTAGIVIPRTVTFEGIVTGGTAPAAAPVLPPTK